MVTEVGNLTTLDDASFYGMDVTLMLSSLLVQFGYHFVAYTLVRAACTYARIGRCYKTNV